MRPIRLNEPKVNYSYSPHELYKKANIKETVQCLYFIRNKLDTKCRYK